MSDDDRQVSGTFEKYDEAIDNGGAPLPVLHARDRERMAQAEAEERERHHIVARAPGQIVEALRAKGAMLLGDLRTASGIHAKRLFQGALAFLKGGGVVVSEPHPKRKGRLVFRLARPREL